MNHSGLPLVSVRLLLSLLWQQRTGGLHDPCTRRRRYNTARCVHQMSPAAALPDRESPADTTGHLRVHRFPLEQLRLPSITASGIPRIGEELPHDSMTLYRVFVSYECLVDKVGEIRPVVGRALFNNRIRRHLNIIRCRSSIALRP